MSGKGFPSKASEYAAISRLKDKNHELNDNNLQIVKFFTHSISVRPLCANLGESSAKQENVDTHICYNRLAVLFLKIKKNLITSSVKEPKMHIHFSKRVQYRDPQQDMIN